jgi:hypothetical protein
VGIVTIVNFAHDCANRYKITRNANYQGLFGYIENGSVVNLALIGVDVEGNSYTGGILGNCESNYIFINPSFAVSEVNA